MTKVIYFILFYFFYFILFWPCITRPDKIGEGAFGEVFKGLVNEINTRGVPEYTVAVKVFVSFIIIMIIKNDS